MADPTPLSPGLESTPRARLAASVRRLIALANRRVDEEGALAAITQIDQVTARLAALPIEKSPTMAQAASTGEHDYFVRNPIAGIYNPVAPPMIVEFVDGADGGPREVRATVRYGRVYQGPPGFVHGGLVAAVLDDSLGLANVAAGTGGMTGTLTIRYSRPTPLETDLRVEARCLGVEGRKIRSWAGLYDGDTLLAEADAVFIIVTADTFRDAQ